MSKKSYMRIGLIFIILSIVSCGPPQQLNDIAISGTKGNLNLDFRTRNSSNTKDFKIKSAEQDDISEADKANGISERWTVKVTFLSSTIDPETKTDKWIDIVSKVVVIKKNGQYIVFSVYFPFIDS